MLRQGTRRRSRPCAECVSLHAPTRESAFGRAREFQTARCGRPAQQSRLGIAPLQAGAFAQDSTKNPSTRQLIRRGGTPHQGDPDPLAIGKRKKKTGPLAFAIENRRRPAPVDVDEIAGNDGSSGDPNWLASWRQNALDLTWSALEKFLARAAGFVSRGAHAPTGRLPDASSEELAERLSEKRLRVSTFGESWVGETFFGSSIAGSVVSVREMFVRRCTNTAGHERCDRRVASFAFVGRGVSCKPNLNNDL